MNVTERVESLFWSRVNKTDTCWEWTAAKTGAGYGAFYRADNGRTELAHRLSLRLSGTRLDAQLQVDHLCRNRGCVNPDHLEQVSIKENLLRGKGVCANNARKTHCKQGHEFTKSNTRWRPAGGRSCRKCAVRRSFEYRRRVKESV